MDKGKKNIDNLWKSIERMGYEVPIGTMDTVDKDGNYIIELYKSDFWLKLNENDFVKLLDIIKKGIKQIDLN